MVFKIQFPLPMRCFGVFLGFLPHTRKHFARKFHFGFRHSGQTFFENVIVFQILADRTAAAVAVTESNHHFVLQLFLLIAVPRAHQLTGIQLCVIGHIAGGFLPAYFVLCGHKKRENICTVYTLPPKCIVGHTVAFVPADFRSDERFHTAFLENLRQRGGIPKHIGQPKHLAVCAEFFFKERLAVQNLPHQAFARRKIAVCLNPHGAFDFPAPLLYHFFDFIIQLGGFFFQIFIQLCLARHKLVFGIFFHQRKHGGKRAQNLFPCLCKRPKPCHVNVRVPDTQRVHAEFGVRAVQQFRI